MIIFNSDGTEPEMCSNGIRCLAHFIHENELFSGDVFSIETKAGTILPAILKQAGVFSAVEVDMGMPQHDKAIMDTGQVLQDRVITLSDQTYQVTCVSLVILMLLCLLNRLIWLILSLGQRLRRYFQMVLMLSLQK